MNQTLLKLNTLDKQRHKSEQIGDIVFSVKIIIY